jgi:hypothetical protein
MLELLKGDKSVYLALEMLEAGLESQPAAKRERDAPSWLRQPTGQSGETALGWDSHDLVGMEQGCVI